MTKRLNNLALSLWDDNYLDELQSLWKEGCFTAKKLFGFGFDKREQLIKVIDGEWQNARALAQKAGITHKSAVKLLISLTEAGEIESKPEEWIDERFRKRQRCLYRRRQNSNLLASLLGITAPPESMVFTHYVVRHLMEDDE